MEKIRKIRKIMKKELVDAMIISSFPNIYYLSSFTSEDCILCITSSKCYLISDSRYTIQANNECPDYFKIMTITKGYIETLKGIIASENITTVAFEDNLTFNKFDIYNKNLGVTLKNINIDSIRIIKNEEEILKIEKACKLTDKCYKHILKFVKVGMRESEVRNEIIKYMLDCGASRESFEIIVASGKRGAMPHGVASNKKIKNGEFVTIDFGCIYKHYCSDMTRSFVMGEPSKKMLEVYEIVREAQQKGIDAAKAGAKAKDVDFACRDYINKMGYGDYFTHSTGHGLGILVHDPISISPNSELVLKEGMVFTIEPGIYIENHFGVRIEDDVVITGDGCKCLTSSSKKLLKLK